MIPLQFIAEYFKEPSQNASVTQKINNTLHRYHVSFRDSLLELQFRVQGDQQNTFRFLLKTCVIIAILLTLPAYIWYLSVNMTTMSNLTAIYNTGCFFAYLFSILMLHDRLTMSKMGAVMLCMLGVLTMACWSEEDNNMKSQWIGILVATLGAALYGFYEVYYKKYCSPTQPTILFANTITGLIGIVTFCLLWIPFPILHAVGYETFQLPDMRTFISVLMIASMSVVYNATFMAVIALVNPVFAAVGVMLTVPAVAIADVMVTGVMTPASTVIGSLLILGGFIILNKQVKQDDKIDQSLQLEGQEQQQTL
jgi:drug/metabolite transporter (DMT)-like permease